MGCTKQHPRVNAKATEPGLQAEPVPILPCSASPHVGQSQLMQGGHDVGMGVGLAGGREVLGRTRVGCGQALDSAIRLNFKPD